jgi:small subunit ribosomal protein S9
MVTDFQFVFQKDKISIGRRKQATARVSLTPGTGKLIINNVIGENYLQYNNVYLGSIYAPLKLLGLENKYDIHVLTNGGGLTGQASAIQLGIARMLCQLNPENRSVLKAEGFLTRDARIKERKKYGLRKARKAPQYSKR